MPRPTPPPDVHPVWCSAGACTVVGEDGEHRSMPYPIPRRWNGGEAPVTVRLVQRPAWSRRRVVFAVAPFEIADDGLVLLGRKEARQLVQVLTVLLAASRTP